MNRLCQLLSIHRPVLQGGMLRVAGAELAAAVSNAGALGTISPYAGMEENGDPRENLRRLIRQTRRLTDRPFAVNIPLDLPLSGLLIDVLLQENIEIVVTSAGSPELYTGLLGSAGIRVIHVVSSVRQAQLAQSSGAAAVIALGIEAGGRLGREPLPLLSLLPQIIGAVHIPVIAAGGIADTQGAAAAFAAGAKGVQLGTRFLASEECLAPLEYKQAIVNAGPDGTVVNWDGPTPARVLRFNAGYAGASAGLIHDILPASAIVELIS